MSLEGRSQWGDGSRADRWEGADDAAGAGTRSASPATQVQVRSSKLRAAGVALCDGPPRHFRDACCSET